MKSEKVITIIGLSAFVLYLLSRSATATTQSQLCWEDGTIECLENQSNCDTKI